ncbi:hypothetical protein JMJ56_07695 [Belnapia sp. T18]|uniref:Uncharacterized protein n=1 Tax=Belnapia arida TaxID=2804533 RepID=A0ABS1TZM7_9PROT|nr:hypothetical protein [Belnapia arida]MBL6077883.1 hypothetical protein [Belnapia arida]
MRFVSMASVGAAALLAAMLPGGKALADDSDIPGINRRTATFERTMHENPEMRPFMNRAPPRIAAAPEAPAAPPAPAPVPTRMNVLHDADALIQEAEARIRAHDARQAELTLERAETALLNGKAAGEAVPEAAIRPLVQARAALHHGQMAASGRQAEAARQIIASAQ